MEELQIIAAAIAGIFLRIGLPIVLTFLLARFLRNLDSRWREEAEQQVNDRKMLEQQHTLLNLWLEQPCHSIMNCSEEQKENCEAYNQTEKPCWEVQRANGNLARRCQDCDYRKELTFVIDSVNI